MLLSSEGIVLGSTKYRENSLISKVISKDRGLITLISSKPKTKKNKLSNYFQPLSSIQFVCYLSNKSSISRVKEVSFSNQHNFFSDDVADTSLRFFIAELLGKVIKEEETNGALYQFLEAQLLILCNNQINKANFHIQFLIELLSQLGMQPQLLDAHLYFDFEEGYSCFQKPKHPNFCEKEKLELLIKATNQKPLESKIMRSSILNILLRYYSIQLGVDVENLKSKQVFEVLFY